MALIRSNYAPAETLTGYIVGAGNVNVSPAIGFESLTLQNANADRSLCAICNKKYSSMVFTTSFDYTTVINNVASTTVKATANTPIDITGVDMVLLIANGSTDSGNATISLS